LRPLKLSLERRANAGATAASHNRFEARPSGDLAGGPTQTLRPIEAFGLCRMFARGPSRPSPSPTKLAFPEQRPSFGRSVRPAYRAFMITVAAGSGRPSERPTK